MKKLLLITMLTLSATIVFGQPTGTRIYTECGFGSPTLALIKGYKSYCNIDEQMDGVVAYQSGGSWCFDAVFSCIALDSKADTSKALKPADSASGTFCYNSAAERDAGASSWRRRQPYGVDTRTSNHDQFVYPGGWVYCFDWETCTP